MNTLPVIIRNIKSAEGVSLAVVETEKNLLQILMVDSAGSNSWIKTGDMAEVIFKETEVFLGRGIYGGISIQNQLGCEVVYIEKGSLLSMVKLRFGRSNLYSVVTSQSVDDLNIKAGDKITAMIMSNDITLMTRK
jgi:molybdopterin-binding protein